MKKMRVLAGLMVLCAAVGFAAAPASAAIISITSDGTAADALEFNSTGNPTIVVPPNPGWAPALPGSAWVSFIQSGDPGAPGFTQLPNGTVVSFFQQFSTTAAASGFITVMADDSTSVWLGATQLFPEAPPNTYTTCSDVPIGCLTTTSQIIALNVAAAGLHTLRFDVAQRNVISFGLDYAGQVTELPEPTSMILLGTGLLGLTARVRRRFSGRQ